jgi:hypothetical protein
MKKDTINLRHEQPKKLSRKPIAHGKPVNKDINLRQHPTNASNGCGLEWKKPWNKVSEAVKIVET